MLTTVAVIGGDITCQSTEGLLVNQGLHTRSVSRSERTDDTVDKR